MIGPVREHRPDDTQIVCALAELRENLADFYFADGLLKSEASGKYSPIEVANWLEDYAARATASLAEAEKLSTGKARPEYRRMAIDVKIQAGLGRCARPNILVRL